MSRLSDEQREEHDAIMAECRRDPLHALTDREAYILDLADDLDAARAENAELRRVLAPFAAAGKLIAGMNMGAGEAAIWSHSSHTGRSVKDPEAVGGRRLESDGTPATTVRITFGNCVAAHRLLNEGGPRVRQRQSGEADPADERVYPCADCGCLRSKNEGGTTFTVCDECWDKHYKREATDD